MSKLKSHRNEKVTYLICRTCTLPSGTQEFGSPSIPTIRETPILKFGVCAHIKFRAWRTINRNVLLKLDKCRMLTGTVQSSHEVFGMVNYK